MDTAVTVGLGWLAGLVTYGVAVLGVRHTERIQSQAPVPLATLPPGLAAVLAVLPSFAMVLDSADRVVQASAVARAAGFVRGDRVQAEELLFLVRAVRRDGEIRDTRIEMAREHGTASFDVRVAPLAVAGLVLILAEDQTEARRMEAVRRDFVANVSHELKTPVGALSLLAETTQDAAEDPAAVRHFAGRMRHEAARLGSLVQELITLSRLESGGPLPAPVAVPVEEVVGEAVDRCRSVAEAKRIDLSEEYDAHPTVLGDRSLLTTAVVNLIDNAVAYSPQGTRVRVRVSRDGFRAQVSVADQGIGIAEADLDRVFERFYRADPARSRATGGTGLGLAIVKHVMANHRGGVRAESQPGRGSTFTLWLPLYATAAGGREVSDVNKPPAVAAGRVLVREEAQ